MTEPDRGVPGALGVALRHLGERVDPSRVERLWLFPPLARGRRESGVVVVSCFGSGDRRRVLTLSYRAEETGRGVTVEPLLQEEGEAPADRLPRVIEGVMRRAESRLEDPASVPVDGDPEVFRRLVDDLTSAAAGSQDWNSE